MSEESTFSMSTAKPVIFGEVLFDHFQDGSVVLGGAPFNVAWHLHAFGQSPVFISRIGDDKEGRQIHETMTSWNMDTSGLQIDPTHPTGAVKVTIENDEPHFDIVKERAYDFIDKTALPSLAHAALLYHGSLALRHSTSQQAFIHLRNKLNAPLFLDVNLREPWWNRDTVLELITTAHWVKLNEDELLCLVTHSQNTMECAHWLLEEKNCQVLFVTRGEAGALAFAKEGQVHEVMPKENPQIVDTVGAGDAFASVLILGLLRDWPISKSLEYAQNFASAIVGVRGATVNDRSFYQPFLDEWDVV